MPIRSRSPPAPHLTQGFRRLTSDPSATCLAAPAVYTVRVEVDNLGQGPFAMVLNGTARGKCDDKLEKGKDDRAEDCKDC